MKQLHLPNSISLKAVNRLLVILIVILALTAGYYHAVTQAWERRYNRLQNSYEEQEQLLFEATSSAQLDQQSAIEFQ
ncbi:MAG: hypothetical protein WDZ94_04370 [Patescibacteria group bacterium]